MKKEQIREYLNQPNQFLYSAVTKVTEVLAKDETIRAEIINSIISSIKVKKGAINATALYRLFYEQMKPYVRGTRFGVSEYATQMFIKNVWENSRIQVEVAKRVRDGYKLIEVKAPVELTKKEKQQLQAKKMREAKARKARERKALEAAKKAREQQGIKEQPKQKAKKLESMPKSEVKQVEQKKEDKKIDEEQLALLRSMHV